MEAEISVLENEISFLEISVLEKKISVPETSLLGAEI